MALAITSLEKKLIPSIKKMGIEGRIGEYAEKTTSDIKKLGICIFGNPTPETATRIIAKA